MKQLSFILFLFFAFSSCDSIAQKPVANGLKWYTDINEAQKQSQATHKPIFALFTGSDWCIWCHRLQNDVFDKPEFVQWAKKNVILLELDFPRTKQLAPELAKQNNELQNVFKVQGFPTVWIFTLNQDSATKKMNIAALGSTGYPQGAEPGKEQVKFLSDANKILANKS